MIIKDKYNRLAQKLKFFFPTTLRSFIRKHHQDYIFRKALREFEKDYQNIAYREDLIIDLIYGWGNLGYSSLYDYLRRVLVESLRTTGPILECGSGLSTILVSIIAKKRGLQLYSFEHNEHWAMRVRKYFDLLSTGSNATVYVTTLVDYGVFEWYSVPCELGSNEFSLIICDGPPGRTKKGRFGLFPIMAQRFAKEAIILFDDFSRKGEQQIVDEWTRLYNLKVETEGNTDIYAVLTYLGRYQSNEPR